MQVSNYNHKAVSKKVAIILYYLKDRESGSMAANTFGTLVVITSCVISEVYKAINKYMWLNYINPS